jgi:hypothetical protein
MSWQAKIFDRLRNRGWHQLGELFESVEADIPLHIAMRHAMQPHYGRVELPANSEARWRLFLATVANIGIESDGGKKRIWTDRVRLRYVANRMCDLCNGPVIRATWQARSRVACLACQPPAPKISAPIAPQPVVVTTTPRPGLGITTIRPSPGWQYRAKRAFAEFVKITRLPFLSVTAIVRAYDRGRSKGVEELLISRGKAPISQSEFTLWMSDYIQRHPP